MARATTAPPGSTPARCERARGWRRPYLAALEHPTDEEAPGARSEKGGGRRAEEQDAVGWGEMAVKDWTKRAEQLDVPEWKLSMRETGWLGVVK